MATNNTVTASSAAAKLASTSATASGSKKTASEDMESRFLNLLITQLKNQDPLNPTDANQMTAQLSQISTVSGIEKLNTSMEKLLESYAGTQNMQAAAMIGKAVLIAGNEMALGTSGALGGFQLETAAEAVTVTIKDSSGKTVQTQEIGPMPAGVNSFVWDGKGASGEALPTGQYTFAVSASKGSSSVSATSLQAGTVSAVTMATDGVKLQLSNNKSVSYSDILQILS